MANTRVSLIIFFLNTGAWFCPNKQRSLLSLIRFCNNQIRVAKYTSSSWLLVISLSSG